jgi:hypothetical protein
MRLQVAFLPWMDGYGDSTEVGLDFDGIIEAQVRAARERGDFDGLPGHGKPLAGLDERDPDWWIKRKMAEEDFEGFPVTPSLSIRRVVRETMAKVGQIDDPALVRKLLGDLNAEIREVNSRQVSGPSSNVLPVDIERYLEQRNLE